MKLIILSLILLFSGVKTHLLSIRIIGVSQIKGTLYIAVFRPNDTFPVFGKQFKGVVKEVGGEIQNYSFSELPEGEYAVAIYQDLNRNNKLDKNILGVPEERYGFSNNARRTFSAPSFQEAKIKLNKDLQITIQLK
jgi:uncharacterized protein (DUF2141 family)